jgi:nicotinamide phosphoribosyltransferase
MNIDTNDNLLLLSDSYKIGGHWKMLPKGAETNFGYYEARGGAKWDTVTVFSLQSIIKKHLTGVVVTREKIEEAAELCFEHFGNHEAFNRAGWEHILNEWGGKLPIVICAATEGSTIPISNVLMTVVNLGGEKTAWLVGYLETLISQVWYGNTVCTLSREAKKLAKHYLEYTSDGGALDFFIHDFACRSVTCMEQAGVGGAAHLVNFKGTDTVPAMKFAKMLYGAPFKGLAYSVPASEHGIMTAEGRDKETDVVRRLILDYPKGILSLVADSYNIYNFARVICGETLKDLILARDGVLVIRPDSGDPEEVMLKLVSIVWEKFGGSTNSKGYKVINNKVRLLWGDGINLDGVKRVLGVFMLNGWAAENIACFGIGSNLLQKVNRDDLRFAFKCSAQLRDGVWHDVYKDPIEGGKTSKRGRIKLIKENGEYKTVRIEEPGHDLLVTVFEAGELKNEITFDEVRNNAAL